jgi:predicted Rdx family selenoprotein
MGGHGVGGQPGEEGAQVITAVDRILDDEPGLLQQFEHAVDGGFPEVALPSDIRQGVEIITDTDKDIGGMSDRAGQTVFGWIFGWYKV